MKRFGDTFYFLAILNPNDDAHDRARSLVAARSGVIVTTHWVLTELADAMCKPPTRATAMISSAE